MRHSLLISMVSIWFLAAIIGACAQEAQEAQEEDGNASGPELVWDRVYGEHRINILGGIARHQDGGYIVAMTRLYYDPVEVTYWQVHHSEDPEESGGMILLTKIDSEGNKIWEKRYGDSDKLYRTAAITESGDSGFVVAAGIKPYGFLPNGTWTGNDCVEYDGDNLNITDPDQWSSILSTYTFKIDGDGRIVWEKTYGGMDTPVSLISDGDGGYLIRAQYNMMMGIDENGNTTWGPLTIRDLGPIIVADDGGFVTINDVGRTFKTLLNDPGPQYQSRYLYDQHVRCGQNAWCGCLEGLDMIASGDGGFFVSHIQGECFCASPQYPSEVTKFDEEFNTIWDRAVFPGLFLASTCLVQSSDGGCVAAFWHLEGGGALANQELYLCRLDDEGNTVWNKTYDSLRTSPVLVLSSYNLLWDQHKTALIESGDGGYVVAGTVLGDLRVLKIDPDGGLVWDSIQGSRDVPLDIVGARDGGYLVAGFTQRGTMGRDAYLARIDAEGEKVWEAWFGGPTTDSFEAITPTSDGGFIATGYTASTRGDRDVYAVKIDGEGHKIWEETYGTQEQDWAEDITPSHDGGFLIVGNTQSYEHGDRSYAYVLEINRDGLKVWDNNYAYGDHSYAHGVSVAEDRYIILGEIVERELTLHHYGLLSGTYKSPYPWALSIDERGGVIWERIYECVDPLIDEESGTHNGCYAASIEPGNGGFAVTTYAGYLEAMCGMTLGAGTFKIDAYGTKIWETNQSYGPWGYLAGGTCDGGFILAGRSLSRITQDGEPVWWLDLPDWQPGQMMGWWLFPYAIELGKDGSFVLAGLTEGPVTGATGWGCFDNFHAGVMHIAKYQDPDLAGIKCPEPYILAAILLMPLYMAWQKTGRTSTPART